MRYRIIIAAIAVAAVPRLATAQSSGTTSSAQADGQAQAAAPQARIDAAMHAAAQAGIPSSLLSSKVSEGQAKHVPPARIASAVETRLGSLMRASTALKSAGVSAGDASDLAVSADALEAGVSQSALVSLTRSAPPQRRVVAVAVLADLVRLGQSSDSALARVNSAVTTSAALANLNAQVASQLKLGGLSSTLDAVGSVRIP